MPSQKPPLTSPLGQLPTRTLVLKVGENQGRRVDQADLIASPDGMSGGRPQIVSWDGVDEDREPALVTGTSGAAISGAEERNNREGKNSDPCDYVRSPCGLVFLSPLDEDAGYTGGIMNESTERTAGMCAVTMMASAHV